MFTRFLSCATLLLKIIVNGPGLKRLFFRFSGGTVWGEGDNWIEVAFLGQPQWGNGCTSEAFEATAVYCLWNSENLMNFPCKSFNWSVSLTAPCGALLEQHLLCCQNTIRLVSAQFVQRTCPTVPVGHSTLRQPSVLGSDGTVSHYYTFRDAARVQINVVINYFLTWQRTERQWEKLKEIFKYFMF